MTMIQVEKFVYLSGTTIRSIHRILQTFNLIEYDHNETDRKTATAYIDMCFTLFQQMVDGSIGSNHDLARQVYSVSRQIC